MKQMPFQDQFEDPITVTRQKRCTTRTKKYGEPGDVLRIPFGYILLGPVERRTLGFVAHELWRPEGVASAQEFIEIWRKLHPKRGYNPGDLGWVHWFTYLGREPPNDQEDPTR